MTVEYCDGGCGKQSPNKETKLYEGNHWIELDIQERSRKNGYIKTNIKKVICLECAKTITIDKLINT